jgi:Fe2+ transport system protein FeoA
MKSNRPLRRRLLELGILAGQDVKITQHASGYILKVRQCTYVIGEDAIDTIREILNEI